MREFLEKFLNITFDPETEIMDVSAQDQLFISSVEHSKSFSDYLISKIKGSSQNERVYLMVDFEKIILEPAIIELLSEQIVDYVQNYLYPNGGCAYGISISRVTVKVSYKKLDGMQETLFKTKEEAKAHLLEQREINTTQHHS